MATKLGIWNAALIEIGSYKLSDTGEAGESGAVLSAVYSDVVGDCLERASWNFATETIRASNDTGVAIFNDSGDDGGYNKVFAKPPDWLRTYAVSADPSFIYPYLDYQDDQNYWIAQDSPLYFRYVSDDTGSGMNLAMWPRTFARFVELELACRVAKKLSQISAAEYDLLRKERDNARREAKNKDAMDESQPKFAPPSSWTRSRSSRIGRDRGSRNRLTG